MKIRKHILHFLVITLILYISPITSNNLQEKQNLKFLLKETPHQTEEYTARLLVFSGTEDPIFTITADHIEKLENLILHSKFTDKKSTRVMGYQGFIITSQNKIKNKFKQSLIKGSPTAEFFLLDFIKEKIPFGVYEHILEQISTGYELATHKNFNQKILENILQQNFSDKAECRKIIRGPDTVPEFNPKTDNLGCFVDQVYNNNCYNYGNDVLTNTFAQPGDGTHKKWQQNTCSDVRRASESDGLVWVGTEYPKDAPPVGHYVALLIWKDYNFHWVRLDSNGLWSHKPGGTPIKNIDNDGNKITDPSKQDFSPWSIFCGYMLTVPSKITIA